MKYTLCDNTVISPDGVVIGTISDATLISPKAVANRKRGQIRADLSMPELRFEEAEEAETGAGASVEEAVEEEEAEENVTPPRPANNADLGDHCPLLMHWRQSYAPAEWADYLARFPNVTTTSEQ